MRRIFLSTLLCGTLLYANVDDDLSGFEEDTTTSVESNISEPVVKAKEPLIKGLTGKLTQQLAYGWNTPEPHDGINSFKSSLFLDYEHKFESGIKIKINAKAYYDSIYKIKDKEDFSTQEIDELESEVELFDAYVEGKIAEKFDYKIGRQVVVWGRSDTIRVTDILNPIDNRRPGMVDIEDLRLPVSMAKFDYFVGDWRITPIAILEQRFSKNPPFGTAFSPAPVAMPEDEEYDDVTYALSIGGEFSGWDINFYGAKVRSDSGYMDGINPTLQHDKITMLGSALNVTTGSWLFKSELAYFDGLKYSTTGNSEFKRFDFLLGFEYNGIADTTISYDFVKRTMSDYDNRLLGEFIPVLEDEYQHALRITSSFKNDTIAANYLISLFGKSLDEGGFQRAWIKYDIADGVNANIGVVDYIGGSAMFDAIEENDMIFVDVSYSF